jgi:hypothetical protein
MRLGSVLLACAISFAATAVSAATFTVTSNADSGAGTLRQAILDANAVAGPHTIEFALAPGSTKIQLASALPKADAGVTIDGRTQTGFSGTPIVHIDGSLFPPGPPSGLTCVSTAGTVRALAIGKCQTALLVTGSAVIAGNYIGLSPAGTPENNFDGIVANGPVRIGGTSTADRNVIVANGMNGIIIAGSGFSVIGNYVGVGPNGTDPIGNGVGVRVHTGKTGSVVGGTSAGSGNVIAASYVADVYFT